MQLDAQIHPFSISFALNLTAAILVALNWASIIVAAALIILEVILFRVIGAPFGWPKLLSLLSLNVLYAILRFSIINWVAKGILYRRDYIMVFATLGFVLDAVLSAVGWPSGYAMISLQNRIAFFSADVVVAFLLISELSAPNGY